MFNHARRSLVSLRRHFSVFTRDAHAAELVATVKPRKGPGNIEEEDYFPKLGGLPEIIVAGRANSGKSTLLNAILGRKGLVETSKKAGHTRSLNFYRIGDPGKLLIVDAPGYGARGRPEWGKLFDEYVRTRTQLRQVLLTLNLKNGLNSYDTQMIQLLFQNIIDDYATILGTQPASQPKRPMLKFQPIFTKADELPKDRAAAQSVVDRMAREVREIADEVVRDKLGQKDPSVISKGICLQPVITSSVIGFGIEDLRRKLDGLGAK